MFLKFKGNLEQIFNKKLFKLSRRLPDRFMIHVHSKKLIPQNFPNCKIIDLPHPLYEDSVKELSYFLLLSTSKVHFVYLGRLEYYKGIDLIINALNILDKNFDVAKRIKITIAGTGNYKIEKTKYLTIEYYLVNRYITNEEFSYILNSADYLILPYRDISQSGIFSKALTSSKPVICNDIGYLSETVRQYSMGYVMDETTPESLVKCIVNAIENRNNYSNIVKNINSFKSKLSPKELSKSLYSNFNG
jgi:glycosyltransferase involved in cell wall biosynthesis